MTANQISYARLLEERRSHVTQEVETQRANLAKERENRRANDLSYSSALYATDINAETSRHNAQLNYWANIYATNQNTILRNREIDVRNAELSETMRANQRKEELESERIGVQNRAVDITSQGQHIQAGTSILNNVIGTLGGLARLVS